MTDMMKEFIQYAKEQFGYDISLQESSTPDTFESLFADLLGTKEEDEILFAEGVSYTHTVSQFNNMNIICNNTINYQPNMSLVA